MLFLILLSLIRVGRNFLSCFVFVLSADTPSLAYRRLVRVYNQPIRLVAITRKYPLCSGCFLSVRRMPHGRHPGFHPLAEGLRRSYSCLLIRYVILCYFVFVCKGMEHICGMQEKDMNKIIHQVSDRGLSYEIFFR